MSRGAKKPCSGYALAENRKDLFGGLAGKTKKGDSTAEVPKKELHRMTLDNIKAEWIPCTCSSDKSESARQRMTKISTELWGGGCVAVWQWGEGGCGAVWQCGSVAAVS